MLHFSFSFSLHRDDPYCLNVKIIIMFWHLVLIISHCHDYYAFIEPQKSHFFTFPYKSKPDPYI